MLPSRMEEPCGGGFAAQVGGGVIREGNVRPIRMDSAGASPHLAFKAPRRGGPVAEGIMGCG